ncbi:hypothetical protein WBJ53_20860 [Spirosoma sp. SC4-14]|uniref:hypothetical protein n=1 Tax=Spirosoma sp. SC4-14 TaxID=3128900 RepID=UPI0030CFDC27
MRLFLVFLVAVLFRLSGFGQDRVRNIRMYALDSAQLEIRYDLIQARPGDSIYFDVRSRLRGPLRVLPEFVRGDIGTRIVAGSDRRIIWNALANGYPLNEEIQVIIRVKTGAISAAPVASAPADSQPVSIPSKPAPTEPVTKTEPIQPERPATEPASRPETQPSVSEPLSSQPGAAIRDRYAGPAWALLSAVAPGVGNIFVQWPKPKIGLRPLLAVGCYGLVAYGLMEQKKAQDDFAVYEQQKNATEAESYYTSANDHHHRYFLATRGAMVVAAADVVLTFLKGLRNNQLRKEAHRIQSFTVHPGLQAGQPTAVIRYTF